MKKKLLIFIIGIMMLSAITIAAEEKSGIVMVINLQLVNSKPTVQNIEIKPGKGNNRVMKMPSGNNTAFHLVVVDHGGSSLYKMDFFFPESITIPPAPPGETIDQLPSTILINNPEITLIVPYFEDASKIFIMNPYDPNPVEIKDLENINREIPQKNVYSLRPAPVESGKMNILIMASGYTSNSVDAFQTQANKIKNTLLETEPFKGQSSKINIHIYANTNTLGCASGCQGIDRLICCDESQVISAASTSGFSFDEIIVVHNTSTYAGGGYREDMDAYKTNSYNSLCVVYDGEHSALMAVHEFGHSFGNLCDEYSYGSEGFTYKPCVNCLPDDSQYPANTVSQLGCDAKPNYFRPDNSVMESFSYAYFNDASIGADYLPDGLEKRLSFFTQETAADTVSVEKTQVAELYVATFNRAPDSAGLDYWVASLSGNMTIEQIAMSFFDQPETQLLYPAGNTDTEFVTSIYQNLFNRPPDDAGLSYWIGSLGGGIQRSVMIQALKNGATGTDSLIINNKTEVGLYFANRGLMDTAFSLSDITDNSTTMDAAKDTIDKL